VGSRAVPTGTREAVRMCWKPGEVTYDLGFSVYWASISKIVMTFVTPCFSWKNKTLELFMKICNSVCCIHVAAYFIV
jgi:hypothetical protein